MMIVINSSKMVNYKYPIYDGFYYIIKILYLYYFSIYFIQCIFDRKAKLVILVVFQSTFHHQNFLAALRFNTLIL